MKDNIQTFVGKVKIMETKKFKPFDKVIVRDHEEVWQPDFYCFWDKCRDRHQTMMNNSIDDDLLPYEGNEHLVGTTDEPDEEVKLEEGELVVYFECVEYLESMDIFLARFDGIANNLIKVKSDCMQKWKFAIRFSDFNPNDMEETKKHILCVKNGRIVKYKG